MEQNVLKPKGEVEGFFDNHIKKLMQVYGINDYLLITDLNEGDCLIRGSPQKLATLLFEELKKNTKLRNVVMWLFRDSGIIKLFEGEVKNHE